jgi:hypothetical protein
MSHPGLRTPIKVAGKDRTRDEIYEVCFFMKSSAQVLLFVYQAYIGYRVKVPKALHSKEL